MKILTNPHFLLTLTSIFWAFNTVAGRAAVGEVSPLLIVSVRWFFVSIILSILCRNQLIETWSILNKKIKWLIFMGLFGFTGFNSAYYVAAHDTIAINLGLVQGTMPAFIIIIAWIWLKDKINFTQFLGVLITFIAVLIVVCSGNLNALVKLKLNSGDIVMIFACTLYAIYAVGLRKKPKISALPLLTFLVGGVSLNFSIPELEQMSNTSFKYNGGLGIPPELIALTLALGLYTATFIAECVRAGIQGISKGQKEAAASIGLNPNQILKLVVMPQALRIIIPPTTNQYLNLTKNSSLAAAIAYPDLVLVFAGTALMQTGKAIEIVSITMFTYLTLSISISILMNWYNKRIAIQEK